MAGGPHGQSRGGRQSGGAVGLSQLRSGGAAAVANTLRRALGALWLADALVKILIPFGGRAADQAYEQLMMAMTGPPGMHRLLAWEPNLFAAHPLLWWLPAAVELCIGLWLVTRAPSRPALAAAACWALVVWVVGEGLGGLTAGVASVLTGYPGAALLYALAAVVLFPGRRPRQDTTTAAEAGAIGWWSRVAWLALWIGAAFYTALPQTGEGGLVFMLFTNESEAPGPLRSMDASELSWLTIGHTTLIGITVAIACLAAGFGVFLAAGFGVFLGALPRLFLSLSVLIALTGWVAMQNFGGILTGSATDVGTGPVLIVLALAFWPVGVRAHSVPRGQHGADAPSPPAAAECETQPVAGVTRPADPRYNGS